MTPSPLRKVLLTSDVSQPCSSPLALLLHDANNKLQPIRIGLDERSMTKVANTIRGETQRLLELVKTGVLPSLLESDMQRLRNRISPILSSFSDLETGGYMVPREVLEQAVGEFNGLIEQGLTYIQSEPPEDREAYGNIAEYVATIVQNYQQLYPQICFTFDSDGDCRTSFYPESIKRALENLLNNAIQALPQADGRIAINLGERSYDATEKPFAEIKDGIYISIEISDNGAGITEDVLKQLQHSSITTKEDGSGLGLVSARTSMMKHHGHLYVESGEGQGARVTALLPSKFPPPPRLPQISR